MIGVRIGVACRPGIEVAAGGGEVGLALADRVQVDAVQPRLQPRDGQRDFDDLARALLTLDERRPTGDSFALDVRVRLYGAALRPRAWRPAAPAPGRTRSLPSYRARRLSLVDASSVLLSCVNVPLSIDSTDPRALRYRRHARPDRRRRPARDEPRLRAPRRSSERAGRRDARRPHRLDHSRRCAGAKRPARSIRTLLDRSSSAIRRAPARGDRAAGQGREGRHARHPPAPRCAAGQRTTWRWVC